MKPYSILCLLMAVTALLGAGCKKKEASPAAPNAPATPPGSGSATPTNLGPAIQTEAAKAFSKTVARLTEKKGTNKLSAKESFELAVGLLGTGKFPEALAVATEGKDLTEDSREKSLFHIIASQCHGAQGKYLAAAETASEGQRIYRQSVQLAMLRYAYFTKVGDKAQIKMAEDALRELEPSGQPVLHGDQIMGFIDFVGKLGKMISACTVIYEVLKDAWTKIQPDVEQLATTLNALWAKESPGGTSRITGTSSAR